MKKQNVEYPPKAGQFKIQKVKQKFCILQCNFDIYILIFAFSSYPTSRIILKKTQTVKELR